MLRKEEISVDLVIAFLLCGLKKFGNVYTSMFVLLLLTKKDQDGEIMSETTKIFVQQPWFPWGKIMTSLFNKAKKGGGICIKSLYLVKGPNHL